MLIRTGDQQEDGGTGFATQAAAEANPIQLATIRVDDEHVGSLGLPLVTNLVSIAGENNFGALTLKAQGPDLASFGFFADEQYPCTHGNPPCFQIGTPNVQ